MVKLAYMLYGKPNYIFSEQLFVTLEQIYIFDVHNKLPLIFQSCGFSLLNQRQDNFETPVIFIWSQAAR